MSKPPPSRPPRRERAEESLLEVIRRTARVTAGPIVLVWMLISAAEFFLAEWFAGSISYLRLGPWWDVPADLRGWALAPVIAALLPLLAAFRTALFRPARAAFHGESLTAGEAASEAFERVLPVFSTRMTITSAQIGALLLSSWLIVRMPLFVVLPLGLLLVPALYVVATRNLTSRQGLWRALAISREHWPMIYAAHGVGLTIVMLVTAGGAVSAGWWPGAGQSMGLLGELKILAAYMTGRYLDWVLVTGTYLYLDENLGAVDR